MTTAQPSSSRFAPLLRSTPLQPTEPVRPDIRLARQEVMRWATSPEIRSNPSARNLKEATKTSGDLTVLGAATEPLDLDVLRQHLETLLEADDEPTLMAFLASPAADWLARHDTAADVKPVLEAFRAGLLSQAGRRQEVWTPLLELTVNLPMSRFERGHQLSSSMQRLWQFQAPRPSQDANPTTLAAWVEQLSPLLREEGPDALLARLAEMRPQSVFPWVWLLARHTPRITEQVVALLERHTELYPTLLARTDLPATEWQNLVRHVLAWRANGTTTKPLDPSKLEPFLRQTHAYARSLRYDEMISEKGLDAIMHRAITAGGGLPADLRALAEQCLGDPTARTTTPPTATWVLAQDPATPVETLEPWLGIDRPDLEYEQRLQRAYAVLPHHGLVERHLQELTKVLFDPTACGFKVAPNVPAWSSPLRDDGEFGFTTLTRKAWFASRRLHPAIMAVVARRTIEPRRASGGSGRPERNIDRITEIIDHPAATPQAWQIIAEEVDNPDVRLKLAQHAAASQVEAVRAVLLRMRRPEALEALLAHPMPEEEFLLLCKRYVAIDPAALLAKAEAGSLPYPIPRNVLAPVLKSGNKDLVLAAMRVMQHAGAMDARYDRMTRTDALAARRAQRPGSA